MTEPGSTQDRIRGSPGQGGAWHQMMVYLFISVEATQLA